MSVLPCPCPLCRETGNVFVGVTDPDRGYCNQCGDEFELKDVAEFIAAWGPVLKWLESHPARRTQGKVAA